MDILKHWQGGSLREQLVEVMLVLAIPFAIFLIFQDLREYRRLPDQPMLMTTAAAIKLAAQGTRPLVQLTDAAWDCDRLFVIDGKTDETYIDLLTPDDTRLIIITFRGNYSCAGLANKVIAGVLQPTGKLAYGKPDDNDPTTPYIGYRKIYDLCGDCSRQYSLSQLQQSVALLLVVIVLLIGCGIQSLARPSFFSSSFSSPSSSILSSYSTDEPPIICYPTWLNGKISLDAVGSNLQDGAILEISRQGAASERFRLQYNGRRSHLLAGGHEGSVSGNRLLNDVVPAATPVTLVAINPDGQSSAPVSFQR